MFQLDIDEFTSFARTKDRFERHPASQNPAPGTKKSRSSATTITKSNISDVLVTAAWSRNTALLDAVHNARRAHHVHIPVYQLQRAVESRRLDVLTAWLPALNHHQWSTLRHAAIMLGASDVITLTTQHPEASHWRACPSELSSAVDAHPNAPEVWLAVLPKESVAVGSALRHLLYTKQEKPVDLLLSHPQVPTDVLPGILAYATSRGMDLPLSTSRWCRHILSEEIIASREEAIRKM